jgi:hypothetical protein
MMRMVTVNEAGRFEVAKMLNTLSAHHGARRRIVGFDRIWARLHSTSATTVNVQVVSYAHIPQAKKIMVNDC